MKRLFLLLVIIVSMGSFTFAQSNDYKKNEYYGGYSNQQVDNNSPRDSFNGFEVAYIRNFHRYFGAKLDFSGAYYRKSDLSGSAKSKGNVAIYNFLVGIQLKNNVSIAKLKPFGHLLAGVGYEKASFICPSCPPNFKSNQTGFAASAGGGLDLRLSDKIDLRAVQADYNPMYIDSRLKNNLRLGVGISFK